MFSVLNLTFIVVYIDCKKIYKHTTPSSGHVIIFFFNLFFTFHRLYNTHHFILVFLKAIFHLEDLFTFKFRDSPSADTNCREESVTFSFPAAPPCFYFEGGEHTDDLRRCDLKQHIYYYVSPCSLYVK